MTKKYTIIDTPMYPCRWKIERIGNWVKNNSWTEYFRTQEEANEEITRREGNVP